MNMRIGDTWGRWTIVGDLPARSMRWALVRCGTCGQERAAAFKVITSTPGPSCPTCDPVDRAMKELDGDPVHEDLALLDRLVGDLLESTGMTLRVLTLALVDHPAARDRALRRIARETTS